MELFDNHSEHMKFHHHNCLTFKRKKNVDLWKRFLIVYRKHQIKFVWIKGHDNNKENEICDKLAVKASGSSNLLNDEGYQCSIKN